MGRNDIRAQMLDYVISSFYPEIQAAHAEDRAQRNAAFFREVRVAAHRHPACWCDSVCLADGQRFSLDVPALLSPSPVPKPVTFRER